MELIKDYPIHKQKSDVRRGLKESLILGHVCFSIDYLFCFAFIYLIIIRYGR